MKNVNRMELVDREATDGEKNECVSSDEDDADGTPRTLAAVAASKRSRMASEGGLEEERFPDSLGQRISGEHVQRFYTLDPARRHSTPADAHVLRFPPLRNSLSRSGYELQAWRSACMRDTTLFDDSKEKPLARSMGSEPTYGRKRESLPRFLSASDPSSYQRTKPVGPTRRQLRFYHLGGPHFALVLEVDSGAASRNASASTRHSTGDEYAPVACGSRHTQVGDANVAYTEVEDIEVEDTQAHTQARTHPQKYAELQATSAGASEGLQRSASCQRGIIVAAESADFECDRKRCLESKREMVAHLPGKVLAFIKARAYVPGDSSSSKCPQIMENLLVNALYQKRDVSGLKLRLMERKAIIREWGISAVDKWLFPGNPFILDRGDPRKPKQGGFAVWRQNEDNTVAQVLKFATSRLDLRS